MYRVFTLMKFCNVQGVFFLLVQDYQRHRQLTKCTLFTDGPTIYHQKYCSQTDLLLQRCYLEVQLCHRPQLYSIPYTVLGIFCLMPSTKVFSKCLGYCNPFYQCPFQYLKSAQQTVCKTNTQYCLNMLSFQFSKILLKALNHPLQRATISTLLSPSNCTKVIHKFMHFFQTFQQSFIKSVKVSDRFV